MIILITIMSVIIAISLFTMVAQFVVYYNMTIGSSVVMIVVPVIAFIGFVVLLGYRRDRKESQRHQ